MRSSRVSGVIQSLLSSKRLSRLHQRHNLRYLTQDQSRVFVKDGLSLSRQNFNNQRCSMLLSDEPGPKSKSTPCFVGNDIFFARHPKGFF